MVQSKSEPRAVATGQTRPATTTRSKFDPKSRTAPYQETFKSLLPSGRIIQPVTTVPGSDEFMKTSALINEIVDLYQKHGWQLRRVLLCPKTQIELGTELTEFSGVEMEEATIDALWFSRPSHQQREAWELRLLAENPYALFETFEADESQEDREDVRREMEARMREYLKKSDE